jgi:shikimate dehydrogenase
MNKPSFLVGLIGAGIQGSRTPAMHEQEGDAQGMRFMYKNLDLEPMGLGPEALPELLLAAQRMGFAGLNITHPCKQIVIPLLDELSSDAKALGAVNTVVLRDGKRRGENTDWWGFAEAFRRNMAGAKLERVVQLGAGGAGAAVAHALLTLGVRQLTVQDVDPGRSGALSESLSSRFGAGRAAACEDLGAAVAEADGLVNCTPIGMAGHPGLPLPQPLLHPALWVADIVYFPLETELLRAARALGCRTLHGGAMAVFQAVEAFRLFTGTMPDPERMLRHFASMVGGAAAA